MGYAKLLGSGYQQRALHPDLRQPYCQPQHEAEHEAPVRARLAFTLLIGVGIGFLLYNGIQILADNYWYDDEEYVNSSEFSEEDIAKITEAMLSSLGLKTVPNIAKANISQDEYRRAHEEYKARLSRSSASKDEPEKMLYMMNVEDEATSEGIELKMPMSSFADRHNVFIESAVLKFFFDHDLEPPTPDPEQQLELRVYANLSNRTTVLVATRAITDARRRWIDFDVTESVAMAVEDDQEVRVLLQLWRKNESRPQRSWSATSGALYVHGHQLDPASRVRRSLGSPSAKRDHLMSLHRGRRTECKGESKKCCRHQFTISFKDLEGFDFIIQPKSFDAGFCRGRCPPRYNPANHHALLQSLIWKQNKTAVPKLCCVPHKLADLEILYFDDDDPTKLKVSNWKNMRVLECACS